MKDHAEAPLTPSEIELVRQGATVVRYNRNDPLGKIRAMLEGMSMILDIPMPTDAELLQKLNEIETTKGLPLTKLNDSDTTPSEE